MNFYINITSNNKKIEAIDYLKGFSIFTIALMHVLNFMPSIPSTIKTLSSIGGTGVHVFFLCSGIGLYTSYLKQKIGYVEFLKKRFFKIYIPYIIIVVISFFLPWLYNRSDKVTALLSHIFLFKMFFPQYEESFGTQFWFVSTIFQMYAIFIPMCWFKDKVKNNKLFVCIFFGISVIWWFFSYSLGISSIRIWGSFCLQYIWEFAIGFVLADAFYNGKSYRINKLVLFVSAIVGIGLQAVMAVLSDSFKVLNDIPALIGYTSLALLLSSIPFIKYFCYKISAFSYEYFLVHILVFTVVFHVVKPQGILMQCVIGCISIILALVLAYFYCKIIKIINNWLSKYQK